MEISKNTKSAKTQLFILHSVYVPQFVFLSYSFDSYVFIVLKKLENFTNPKKVAALLTMKGSDRSQCLVGNWALPPVSPKAELRVRWTMRAGSASSNGFVNSHRLQGKRVLPMTVALGKVAAVVARAHPGWYLKGVEAGRLFGGVDLEADTDVELVMRREKSVDVATALSLTVSCKLNKKT